MNLTFHLAFENLSAMDILGGRNPNLWSLIFPFKPRSSITVPMASVATTSLGASPRQRSASLARASLMSSTSTSVGFLPPRIAVIVDNTNTISATLFNSPSPPQSVDAASALCFLLHRSSWPPPFCTERLADEASGSWGSACGSVSMTGAGRGRWWKP